MLGATFKVIKSPSRLPRQSGNWIVIQAGRAFASRRRKPDCEYLVNIRPFPAFRRTNRHSALGSRYGLRYNNPVKPSIFVVEDDPDISRLVRHHLENEAFTVRVYPTGMNVLADAERQRPALFVLDIMVPGKDGLELCRNIRQTIGLASVPVIFLTAKSSEADRVLGLELGADDYIAKPFSPREFVARVKAVLRRFERPLPPSPMKVGDIEIDPAAMTLTVRGNTVATTATEFRLLDYFARHKGRVFSRDHLLDSVWRDTAYVTPRSVDVYVRRIREKIEPDPENPRYLKTVRGAGYRFEVPK